MAYLNNNLPSLIEETNSAELVDRTEIQFLQVTIAENTYGVAIHQLNDVVNFKTIFSIPTAPSEVLGLVNLHGRIVSVLDISQIVASQNPDESNARKKHKLNDNFTAMTVNYKGDMLALIVEKVGEVIALPYSSVKEIPTESRSFLHQYCTGFVEINDKLILLIDVFKIIEQFITYNTNEANLSKNINVGIDSRLFENPL